VLLAEPFALHHTCFCFPNQNFYSWTLQSWGIFPFAFALQKQKEKHPCGMFPPWVRGHFQVTLTVAGTTEFANFQGTSKPLQSVFSCDAHDALMASVTLIFSHENEAVVSAFSRFFFRPGGDG